MIDAHKGSRWNIASDGFGLQRDDENGVYCYYADLFAANTTIAALRDEVERLRKDADHFFQLSGKYLEQKNEAEARAEALRVDAELGAAIQRAAKDLPEDWMLQIEVGQGSGTVRLIDYTGEEFKLPEWHGDTFAGEVNAAIDAARKEKP